jgi:hypothetical protein
MSSLREKAKEAGLGSGPPPWGDKGLGRADTDPAGLVRGLGISGFTGTGNDWITDVYNVLRIATRSSYLNGLYSDPVPYRSQNVVTIGSAPDLYEFSPRVMRRMIMSTLWAADKMGRIALPSRLKVDTTNDNKGLRIYLG